MMTSALFLLVSILAISVPPSVLAHPRDIPLQEYQMEFAKFQVKYNKTYPSQSELDHRFKVFKNNYHEIVSHNAQKGITWTMGVNEFADWTYDEFRTRKLGCFNPNFNNSFSFNDEKSIILDDRIDIPKSIDWRKKGAVTSVKDQDGCGTCFAFSATGAIEGAVYIKTGKLVDLSNQQVVDCDKNNGGCAGGTMNNVFIWVIQRPGICSDKSYPYVAKDQSCNTSCKAVSFISNYKNVAANNEDALQAAVAKQPVSVGVQADPPGFMFYKSGIFSGPCGYVPNHGVLAVGYGVTASGKKYWRVKNSWGSGWGEDGYIRLGRSGGKTRGQCGIAMYPSYPVA